MGGKKENMKPSIRSYLREELAKLLLVYHIKGHGPFTAEEITSELQRRDEIEEKRRDTVRYPELQRWFH